MMVLVRTTLDSEDAAEAMASRLVQAGLACCVHTLPIRSTYLWQGRLERATEWLVEARAPAGGADALAAAVAETHPYEVPLIERVGSTVNEPYAAWAATVTQ